jgi:hypothetical protein
MGVEADSEFHRYVLLMRRARAAGSKTVSIVGLQAASAIPGFLVLRGIFIFGNGRYGAEDGAAPRAGR